MNTRRCDVVIVGAGIAGLAAARALVTTGRGVIVHEARERVGGRLLSLEDGGAVDLGATWFWPDEPAVHALIEELDVPVFPQALDGDALYEPDSAGARRITGNPVGAPCSRFAAGAQSLATLVAGDLPAGTVHLADAVTRIEVQDGGVIVETASGRTTAEHAIVALPPALAVDTITFDPPLEEPVRSVATRTAVWMAGVVKAVAMFDEPWWRRTGLAGSVISHVGPFREIHDHSGPDRSPAALFGFASADQFASQSPEHIGEVFGAQLSRMFGAAASASRATHVLDWSRDPYTSCLNPSRHATTATYGHAVFQEPVAGRVHWASTETATEYAGHIEGALRAAAVAVAATTAGDAGAFLHVDGRAEGLCR